MEQQRHITDNLVKRETALPDADFFSAMKSSVLANTHPVKIVRFYKRSWFLSSAAAILIALVTVPFLLKEGNQDIQQQWNALNREELYAYVNENIEDFETEDISAQLTQLTGPGEDTGLNPEASFTSHKETEELFESLEKEEILDYLEEEVVEIDDESITGYPSDGARPK